MNTLSCCHMLDNIVFKISGLIGKPVLRLRTGFLLHFRAALPPDASEYPEGQGKRREKWKREKMKKEKTAQ